MWFDVNAALKEVLEQCPDKRAGVIENESAENLSRDPRLLRYAKVERPQLTGGPNQMANAILGMLRECETLDQVSEIITRHQPEIARIVEAEPARKAHIESYLRYRWSVASSANIGGYTS